MDTMQVERSARVATRLPFRIRQAAPGDPAALEAAASETAAAGFDALLLPCPYASTNGVPADLTRASAAFGSGAIETSAPLLQRIRAETGLAIIVDLPVGVAAAGSPLHRAAADRFIPVDEAGRLDPRLPLELDRVRVRLDTPGDIEFYASTLTNVLSGLKPAGIDGICLRGLAALQAATIADLFTSVRRAHPDALLIADTQGIAWEALATIGGGLFDYSIASSAWWNRRDEWFYAELDHLRHVAPPLIPASTATADPTARHEDRVTRDLGLAAALGAGWILPVEAPIPRHVAAMNRTFGDTASSCMACAGLIHLNGVHGPVLATLRTPSPDPRAAPSAFLSLLNMDPQHSAAVDPAVFLPALGGLFAPIAPRAAPGPPPR